MIFVSLQFPDAFSVEWVNNMNWTSCKYLVISLSIHTACLHGSAADTELSLYSLSSVFTRVLPLRWISVAFVCPAQQEWCLLLTFISYGMLCNYNDPRRTLLCLHKKKGPHNSGLHPWCPVGLWTPARAGWNAWERADLSPHLEPQCDLNPPPDNRHTSAGTGVMFGLILDDSWYLFLPPNKFLTA